MVYANVACVVSAQSTPDVNIRHTPAPGMYDFEMFQQKDLFYTPAGNDTLVLGGDQSRIKQCCVLSKTSCIRDCIGKFLNNREVYEWVNGFFSNPDAFKKWRGFLRDQKYGKKNDVKENPVHILDGPISDRNYKFSFWVLSSSSCIFSNSETLSDVIFFPRHMMRNGIHVHSGPCVAVSGESLKYMLSGKAGRDAPLNLLYTICKPSPDLHLHLADPQETGNVYSVKNSQQWKCDTIFLAYNRNNKLYSMAPTQHDLDLTLANIGIPENAKDNKELIFDLGENETRNLKIYKAGGEQYVFAEGCVFSSVECEAFESTSGEDVFANVTMYRQTRHNDETHDKYNEVFVSPVRTTDMPWSYVSQTIGSESGSNLKIVNNILVSRESYMDAMLKKATGGHPKRHWMTIPGVMHVYKTPKSGVCVYLMMSVESKCCVRFNYRDP